MLRVLNLTFSYDGKTPIFKNFEISVNSQEFVCLQGKNGSGKTTLLNIIAGVTYAPKLELELFGKKVTAKVLKDEVIYIPTKPEFYGMLTPKEFIDLVAYLWKQGKAFRIRVQQYLLALELEFLDKQKIGEFSLGMQYKLYLATFLALPRKILLLDEPFNALDLNSRAVAIELVQKHVAENDGCCIFSSHVTAMIEQLETRVVNIEGKADEK